MSEIQTETPQYEIHLLKLADADSIVIMYKADANSPRKIIVVDAGNVEDWKEIKEFIYKRWGSYVIDIAICTHPDRDHKGGFFGLFEDTDVKIRKFCAIDPYRHIRDEEYEEGLSDKQKKKISRRPFDYPTAERDVNLLDIAESKNVLESIQEGCEFDQVPLKVVGPSNDYYHEAALGMMNDYEEVVEDPEITEYDEDAEMSEEEALSVIDLDNETSCTNQSSVILLFRPNDRMKFLLTGDTSCGALLEAVEKNGDELKGCVLKVPHHGSRHNLTTKLIAKLSPTNAAICAKGSRKHPNPGIVFWLSKYCNVYSTHKGAFYWGSGPTKSPAKPLRAKQ